MKRKKVIQETDSVKMTIMRYELAGDPIDRRIVGFTLTNTETDKTDYIEIEVPLSKCKNKSDYEICNIAYKLEKENILKIKRKLMSKSAIIGYEFVPKP
jgi:hypothetical protein